MTTLQRLAGIVLLSAMAWPASAQAPSGNSVPVTAENFVRAESDLYLSTVALKEGGFGKFEHHRELAPIDAQTVIRMNRDTLYSAAVFDLDAGPATITLPDAGKRFMSMQLISQDEYSPPAKYGTGKYVITRKHVGTRYVLVGVRTLVDPVRPSRHRESPRAAGRHQSRAKSARANSRCRTGTRSARRRCATR